MGQINILDFHVANLIAAGEVVDRPCSVIKELLENAIDAGADQITVEIKRGGVEFMRVSDNGCGMSRDDVPIAIKRHATSKISSEDDLDGIRTLGFRGEALAAISSVSRLRIMTKTENDATGTLLVSEGGSITDLSDAGCRNGTTIIVEELFANVPARRKFLKKDVTETAACAAVAERIALSRPDISIKFIADGVQKFATSGDGRLINAIYAIIGRDFARKLIPINELSEGVEIIGYIGTPENVRGNRNFQNFFINGRYIKSKTATAAIEQAYDSYISGDKFPCCVLNIGIHPSFVDVNVHPTKLEVKFSNERLIFDAVYGAVRNALSGTISRPEMRIDDGEAKREKGMRTANAFTPVIDRSAQQHFENAAKNSTLFDMSVNTPPQREHIQPQPSVNTAAQTNNEQKNRMTTPAPSRSEAPDLLMRAIASKGEKLPFEIGAREIAQANQAADEATQTVNQAPLTDIPKDEPAASDVTAATVANEDGVPFYKILGSAFNSYIFVELEDKIMMIDKHAAHERINFERMKANMKKGGFCQILMIPLTIKLSPDEYSAVCEYAGEIKKSGFDYETSEEDRSLTVFQIPADMSSEDALIMIQNIAGSLADGTGSANVAYDMIFEKALYQAACKASVKAGRIDSEQNVDWIVRTLLTNPEIKVCPHGRPVAFELSQKDIEKQFKRI